MASSRKRHYTTALFRYRLSSTAQPANAHCNIANANLNISRSAICECSRRSRCTVYIFLYKRPFSYWISFLFLSAYSRGAIYSPDTCDDADAAATLISLCKPIFHPTPSIRNRHIALFFFIPSPCHRSLFIIPRIKLEINLLLFFLPFLKDACRGVRGAMPFPIRRSSSSSLQPGGNYLVHGSGEEERKMKYVRTCEIPAGVGRARTDAQHQTCNSRRRMYPVFFSFFLKHSLSRSLLPVSRDPVSLPFILKNRRRRYEITQAEWNVILLSKTWRAPPPH